VKATPTRRLPGAFFAGVTNAEIGRRLKIGRTSARWRAPRKELHSLHVAACGIWRKIQHMNRMALVLAVFVSCPIFAQQDAQRPRLAVSVRSAKTTYRITEKIQLEIQVSNVGQNTLLINRHPGWGVGRIDIRVFDSNGKEVVTSFLADEVPPLPKADDFLELGPNEFFGVRVEEPITHFVNSAGMYEMIVDYTSPLPEKWIRENVKLPSSPLWGRERGTIESSRIKILVEK